MKTGKNSQILLLALTIIIAAGIALYGIHTRHTKYYDTTPKFSGNRLYADWEIRTWKTTTFFHEKHAPHVLKQIGDVSKRAVFISSNSAKGSVCIPCPYRSMRDIFHIYKLCVYVKVEASSQNVILSARQSTKKATARVCWLLAATLAERGGFEPPKRFRRLHAFQACLFNHSSIFPCFAVEILSVYIKPGAKLRFYFEITLFRTGKTHCQAFGNIFFAVLQVISYTSSVVRP